MTGIGSAADLVLQVPVPRLEEFVRGRHAHYDPAYVSSDPGFTHAHITVLGPWLDEPGEEDLAVVAAVVAGTPAFDFVLDAAVHAFPDGILHLRPAPDEPFRALTRALREAFPSCPPYAGAFGPGEPTPHLTLDHRDHVSVGEVHGMLDTSVPARCRAERLELVRWRADACATVASWPLGGRWTGARPQRARRHTG